MSQESINKALQKTLLSPLTYDELWSQFLESISYELQNMRDKYGLIKTTWDINYNNKDNLIRISESFGYTPNLIINNTFSMTKKEIELIPYRIRKKTTRNGYYFIFKQNDLNCNIFNYYWSGEKFVKTIDLDKTMENLQNAVPYLPFNGIVPVKNYSTTITSELPILDYFDINGEIQYDNNNVRIYSLDQKSFNPFWRLDKSYMRIPTKHLGIDYIPQTYKSTYVVTLGFGDLNKSEYGTVIPQTDTYIHNSIKVFVNTQDLNVQFIDIDDKEYMYDDEDIISQDSYYDNSTGELKLIFNEIPENLEISISYDLNLMFTKDYYYYLEQGTEYTRRCPIVPHIGLFLTTIISQAKGTDYYKPNANGYTIEDLKLKAQTTSSFNRMIFVTEQMKLDNATDEDGNPNGKSNYILDDTIRWHLDSDASSSTDISDKIKYIACGNGALPMINNANYEMFNLNYVLYYYNFNTDDDLDIIRDISYNTINLDVEGNTVKVKGIINKSLDFDGSVYCHSDSQVAINNGNYTFGMWFNANKEPSTSTEVLFDNFMTIAYDYENEKIIIESQEFDCSRNTDHFLCLLINSVTSKMSVYVDCVLLGEFTFIISVSSSYYLYVGCDENYENKFYGIIDNLWLILNNINLSQMQYIYNNKISLISHMGNRIAYYKLLTDEIYNTDDYFMVLSYVKGMDVNNENYRIVNDEPVINSRTKIYPIIDSYFSIDYKNSVNEDVKIECNEKGQFYRTDTNESISGGINFETGEWTMNRDTIKSVSQKVIHKPTRTPYEYGYKVIRGDVSDWYYQYDIYGDPTQYLPYKITYDEMDLSQSTLESKIMKYNIPSGAVGVTTYLYSTDEENFYFIENNIRRDVKGYYINSDNDETILYSRKDAGADTYSLYVTMNDLMNNTSAKWGAYFDMGESSSTTYYSKNGGQDAYLDVKLSAENKITKVTVNGGKKGYILGPLDEPLSETTVVYDSLLFNQTLPHEGVVPTLAEFVPKELSVTKTETDLDVTLVETVEKYSFVYSILYIERFDEIITRVVSSTNPNIEIVKDTITFNYWIYNELGIYTKCTGTVLGEGIISGPNILSGGFDYTTNTLSVVFINPVSSDILVSFEYYYSLDINTEYPLLLNYKIKNSTKINEIGLEDENHELMAYMTFPDVEFNSIDDNISVMFVINKQN